MNIRIIILSLALAPWVLLGAASDMTNVINVGVSSQEPFVYIRSGGAAVKGFLPDILNYVAAQKGWQIRYIPDTPANNAIKLEQGALDLVMPAPWPSDRIGRQDFTREGMVASCGQLYVANSVLVFSLSDLAGKTIAVMRGDPHYEQFRAMLTEARIRCEFIEMDSYTQILESLDRRSVDTGLIDRFFGERSARDYGVTASPITSPTIEFRFASPRNRSGKLIEGLDYWQSVLKADRKSLYYRSLEYWTRLDRRYLPLFFGSLMILIALLVSGGFAVRRLRQAVDARTLRLNAANDELRKSYDTLASREKTTESQKVWYRSLLNSTEDIILVHGLDARNHPTKFIEANRTACHRLGYTRTELLALTPRDIEVMSDSGSQQPYAPLLKSGSSPAAPGEPPAAGDQLVPPHVFTERTYRTKSGNEIPMEITVRVLEHEGRPAVFCCAHDITRRRETQFALKESERRFHDFFARSPIGIALYDIGQRLMDINPSALGMFGVSDRSHFVAPTLPQLPEMSEEVGHTVLKGGTARYEAVMDFDLAKEAGLVLQSTRSGKSHFDILITNLGLDWDFKPKGFLVMLQDITEHRRAEEALRQNERLLRQAHKMEAIGTLAGGIAHDFNNILTPIIGYTEMALFGCTPEDTNRHNLDEVLKASHRAKDLVRQILAFSRQTEGEERPLRLAAVIEEVMTLLRGSVRPDIQLHADIKTDRDMVRADPTQLHQVLMNLGTNALHAMRRTGGILEYSLHPVVLDSKTKGPLSRLRRGSYVDLTVRDTGIGMDRATVERIFEPFFTTKKSGEGTGMGLAVAHGIVTALHGIITVESEVGKGSLFHVVLPLMEKTGEKVPVSHEPVPRGTERVLFVDDEKDIVNMVAQMLKTLGYTPVACLRSQDAIALLREAPDRFDILITDQVMPGMTGMELVREAHQLRPNLPVLLCTGFSKSLSDEELLEGGVKEILMKPIVLRQLAEAIRRVLTPHKPSAAKPA
jgi:signal transduction histidine kinase/CheY-like chemotaxis protein/ABC-type amino acid transport substrate-binding protein